MEPWLLALILKPLVFLLIMAVIVAPLKYLFVKHFPEGRVKRVLLTRTN